MYFNKLTQKILGGLPHQEFDLDKFNTDLDKELEMVSKMDNSNFLNYMRMIETADDNTFKGQLKSTVKVEKYFIKELLARILMK